MIIPIDAKNPVIIQHPFMIKAAIEGMYLNITKAVYDKPLVNIILMGKSGNYCL
jgi:hypothetical protein